MYPSLIAGAFLGILAYREWCRYRVTETARQQAIYEQIAQKAAELGIQTGIEYGEKVGIMKAQEFRHSPN